MKANIIMPMALAAVLAAGAMWLAAPQRSNAAETNAVTSPIRYYTCPMHPSVNADKPGDCPVCGMHLVPVYKKDGGTNTPPATVTNQPAATMPGCCSPGGCCR